MRRWVGVGFVLALCLGCNESPSTGDSAVGGGGDHGGEQAGSPSSGRAGDGGGAGGESTSVAPVPYLALAGSPGTSSLPVVCTDGSCEGSSRCFQITEQFGICDRQLESSACGECAEGTFCKTIRWHSSGPMSKDVCVPAPCAEPGECGAEACLPPSFIGDAFEAAASRCAPASCHRDQECTIAPGGRCVAVLYQKPQQVGLGMQRVTCLYPKTALPDPSPACAERAELPEGITCD